MITFQSQVMVLDFTEQVLLKSSINSQEKKYIVLIPGNSKIGRITNVKLAIKRESELVGFRDYIEIL